LIKSEEASRYLIKSEEANRYLMKFYHYHKRYFVNAE